MTETIGCAEAVRRLWAHLDDGLDAADRDGLEAHLARCLRCCGELAFARELRAMLAQRTAADPAYSSPIPAAPHN